MSIDPGSIGRKITGGIQKAIGAAAPASPSPAAAKSASSTSSAGIAGQGTSSSTGVAGIMLQAMTAMAKTAPADATSARDAPSPRAAAWLDVAGAVASAAASGAAAGAGASAAAQAVQQIGLAGGKLISDTIGHVRNGSLDHAQASFVQLGDKLKGADVNGLVQWVLRESYAETTQDLRFYADKVKSFNDVKSAVREYLGEARPPVGDDAQLANVDLQNALQKHQQVLQQMSNVSKMLHDTAMTVVRKIGG